MEAKETVMWKREHMRIARAVARKLGLEEEQAEAWSAGQSNPILKGWSSKGTPRTGSKPVPYGSPNGTLLELRREWFASPWLKVVG